MFDNLKPGDTIERREFDVEIPGRGTHRYTLTLEKSSMFEYGNGTCASVMIDGRFSTVFDTRYSPEAVNDFPRWAKERVSSMMRDVYFIYPIDPVTGERQKK